MDYFKYFPYAEYVFGNEAEEIGTGDVVTELFQDISAYVDIIDDVKKNSAFSLKYYIQDGERPDQVSTKLYGRPSYHWTFFMMNDHLRTQGWPLSMRLLNKQLRRDFPHEVALCRDDLNRIFRPGQVIVGSTSGARGKILRRRLDVGCLHIQKIGKINFSPAEVITSKSVNASVTEAIFVNTIKEFRAPHHYEYKGERVDIDPHDVNGPPAFYQEITFEDHYIRQNDKLKEINIIKPDSIREVTALYREALGK